jgi:thiopurine S-methyltransferase
MEAQFWLTCWQNNELGFQLDDAHPLLQQCLPALLTGRQRVLVPLCGKSLDMHYLARFLPVVGAELSAIACRDFFTESGLNADVETLAAFQRYSSSDITLWQGDFFALTAAQIGECDLVYDRAALIALPPPMRCQYVAKLRQLLPAGATILLISLEYPQHEKQGPPFCVPQDEIRTLFEGCKIEPLATLDLTGKGFARRRFATSLLLEQAYSITLP